MSLRYSTRDVLEGIENGRLPKGSGWLVNNLQSKPLDGGIQCHGRRRGMSKCLRADWAGLERAREADRKFHASPLRRRKGTQAVFATFLASSIQWDVQEGLLRQAKDVEQVEARLSGQGMRLVPLYFRSIWRSRATGQSRCR
jgi:hypothetical protein